MPLIKEGANPCNDTDPTVGTISIFRNTSGAALAIVMAPTLGVIILPLTTLGAAPTNDKSSTLGVTTFPVTTTLGAEPIKTASPEGVITSPPTTLGAIPKYRYSVYCWICIVTRIRTFLN